MKRDLQPHELIERSIIKKFRKTIWNPFTLAVRQYQLIQPGDKIAAVSYTHLTLPTNSLV